MENEFKPQQKSSKFKSDLTPTFMYNGTFKQEQ